MTLAAAQIKVEVVGPTWRSFTVPATCQLVTSGSTSLARVFEAQEVRGGLGPFGPELSRALGYIPFAGYCVEPHSSHTLYVRTEEPYHWEIHGIERQVIEALCRHLSAS